MGAMSRLAGNFVGRYNVIYHNGPPKVSIRNKTRLDLVVRPGSDIALRERVLLAW